MKHQIKGMDDPMSEHSDRDGHFAESRTSKRKDAKEVSVQRQRWLEALAKLPVECLPEWQADPEFGVLLDQLRSARPSAGRQRLIRYMVRRSEVEIWAEVSEIVEATQSAHAADVELEKALVALRDRLVDDPDGLDMVYDRFPTESHQQLRNLILTARRKKTSPTGKGARRKLLARLRELGLSPTR